MRVLIVEDDDGKAADLQRFIEATYDLAEITIARSLQAGLRSALSGTFNIALLDMTMRNFDRSVEEEGGRPHHFAGREILRQLQREEIVLPAVVVTHFDRFGDEADEVTLSELKEELRRGFSNYIGTVHYRSNLEDWKIQLQDLIGHRIAERGR